MRPSPVHATDGWARHARWLGIASIVVAVHGHLVLMTESVPMRGPHAHREAAPPMRHVPMQWRWLPELATHQGHGASPQIEAEAREAAARGAASGQPRPERKMQALPKAAARQIKFDASSTRAVVPAVDNPPTLGPSASTDSVTTESDPPTVGAEGERPAAHTPDAAFHAQVEPPPAEFEAQPPPHYNTRVPPARTLHYRVTRAQALGTGELHWAHDGRSYRATLQSQGPGLPSHDWSSEGRLGSDGIEPSRMLTRRKGRLAAAANFDIDAGTASFSGPREVRALARGAQDRLTWLLQLAAIVDADPERFVSGAHIDVQVIGPRGDASVWRFEILGPSNVALVEGGVITALELVRRGQRLHDLEARVWLDPRDHHLPVRWQWQMLGLRQPPVVWDQARTGPASTPP